MEGSGSSGFDMSKMSTAEKVLAVSSILLLIDSFLPWQRSCSALGELGELIGQEDVCFSLSAWSGSGGDLRSLDGSPHHRAHRRRRALHDGRDEEREHGVDVPRQDPRVHRPGRGCVRAPEVPVRAHRSPRAMPRSSASCSSSRSDGVPGRRSSPAVASRWAAAPAGPATRWVAGHRPRAPHHRACLRRSLRRAVGCPRPAPRTCELNVPYLRKGRAREPGPPLPFSG